MWVMDIRSIRQRCEQVSLASIEDLEFNVDGVSLTELYQDDWIRILVVREREISEFFTIEIEFSTPTNETTSDNPTFLLSQAIDYLKYMQNLESIGFTLELVDHDWLWSAYRKFTEFPGIEFFRHLQPPSS